VTPAADLLDLLDLTRPAPEPDMPSAALAPSLAKAAGVDRAVMTPIATPVVVSGLHPRRLSALQGRLERATGTPVMMVSGRSSGAGETASALVPGAPAAAVLASGDFTAGAVGTTTVRVGKRVVMFGHPFTFEGPARFGLAPAQTFTVVEDAVWGPYALAGVGDLVGAVTQDRLAGVVGVVGRDMPATVLRTTLRNVELGTERSMRTVLAQRFAYMPDLAMGGIVGAFDSAFDRIGSGSARLTWVIRGTRADGAVFRYARADQFDAAWDLAWEAPMDLLADLSAINTFSQERIRVTRVVLDGTVSLRRRAAEIRDVAVAGPSLPEPVSAGPVFVTPGETLTVAVTLQPRRGEPVVKLLTVPAPDTEGMYTLAVRGGGAFSPEGEGENGGMAPSQPATFDELLTKLSTAPHNSDVVVRLVGYDASGAEQVHSEQMLATRRVISGERSFEIWVGGPPPEEPPAEE
jgi:hypothetical protein